MAIVAFGALGVLIRILAFIIKKCRRADMRLQYYNRYSVSTTVFEHIEQENYVSYVAHQTLIAQRYGLFTMFEKETEIYALYASITGSKSNFTFGSIQSNMFKLLCVDFTVFHPFNVKCP